MYWYMDIGINIKQAPFVIVLMFLQIGFSNKLAQINPVIGLIVNFITIFLIMYIPSAKPEYKAYMPFLLCYIFNQSNPAEGHDFVTRMLSLLIGGVIVSLVYYFKNKNLDLTKMDFFKELNVNKVYLSLYDMKDLLNDNELNTNIKEDLGNIENDNKCVYRYIVIFNDYSYSVSNLSCIK